MGASLGLSLRNIYETLAISVPTVLEAVGGSLTKRACDVRLGRWAARVLDNARISLDVVGRSNVRQGEIYLVMSNHQSLYDIPVLFVVLGSEMRMIAKKELFRVPVFGPALEAGGFVSIDRTDHHAAVRSLQHAHRLLEAGTHVWIAPEGTRSDTGELLPFKKGAFHLALESALPILPVTLAGTRDALPARAVRSRKGAQVRVTIHPPIDPRPYAAHGKGGRERLMREVRATLQSGLR